MALGTLRIEDSVIDGSQAMGGAFNIEKATLVAERIIVRNTQASSNGMTLGGAAFRCVNDGSITSTDSNVTSATGQMMGGMFVVAASSRSLGAISTMHRRLWPAASLPARAVPRLQ